MKSFVMKLVLPAAAFVLASAGAVSTSSKSEGSLVDVQGWKRTAPFACTQARLCNNLSSAICMDGTDQVYAKATPTSDCTQILTHRP